MNTHTPCRSPASGTPPHLHALGRSPSPAFRNEMASSVHVKVDSLPIAIARVGEGIDIRGNWKQVKWERYDMLGEAIRKVIAMCVELDLEEVSVVGSLFVFRNSATARLCIDLPGSHRAKLESPAVQQAMGILLEEIKVGPSVSADSSTVSTTHGQGFESPVPGPEQNARLAAQVLAVGREVRSVLGGCTLPVPCAIESSAWDKTFEVSGKLAPKPRPAAPLDPEVVERDVRVDGFIRNRRVVYLAPVDSPLDVKEIVFEEEKWLARVIECASLDAPVCRAVFEEVSVGPKVKRTLLSLSTVDDVGAR